jgi:hypothetical protein
LTYAWSTWTADIISSPNKYRLTLPSKGTEASAYFKAFEEYLLEHKKRYFNDKPFQYLAQSDKYWKLIGPFDKNNGDIILTDKEKMDYEYKGGKLTWIPAIGNTLVMKLRWIKDGYFLKAKPGQTVYALTYIHSNKVRDVNAWVNFETSGRSNRVYTGIATNGEFDINGGEIFINDKKLIGSKWNNPGWQPEKLAGWGNAKEQEMPWTEEELYWTRKPTVVPLKKGWNKVFVKIPYVYDIQNWMFTFVPLNMNGLKFSTDPEEEL